MLYLSTPSGGLVREAMESGRIGCMTTPMQGNRLPPNAWYAADNGVFGKGWPGYDKWMRWLEATVADYGTERLLFATAPDVVGDSEATFHRSRTWLRVIRNLGAPAAFVAQNGIESNRMIPWREFDILFLGGSPECLHCNWVRPATDFTVKNCPHCRHLLTEWKLGLGARELTAEAVSRGIKVHMGRVNSKRRLAIAMEFGCATADGTYIAFGPDKNLPRITRWLDELAGAA
jgi:hypothetical protein